MVVVGGLEPPTSSLSEMRSNQLSYTTICYDDSLTSSMYRTITILSVVSI